MKTRDYVDKILASDENKKIEMADLICEMMEDLKEKDIKEYERKIYEISEGRELNEDKARCLIEKMKPFGKKWEINETEEVKNAYGFTDLRSIDFWIVMNSAFNDYNDLFKDNVEWYAKFSKDFIKDEDAVDDKVYYYFTMIPKE